ncbi:MCE family protein [Gordonia polyisoprenivorans]|uniref:MCE family protein n=1 Tax=Gordonia polyisoprenivorans TaxID=84595 RepID=UPI000B99DBD4|nr:MCE family protein [Gordonia polyisoprenivorans]OZC29211.1 mammalian cell entry protein [Gordonia polyisoprenivorans]
MTRDDSSASVPRRRARSGGLFPKFSDYRKTRATSSGSSTPGKITVCVLAVAAIIGATAYYVDRSGSTSLTVMFRNSAGLYVGDEVMVLGVPVGKVDSITPGPNGVQVALTVDGQPIPKDAKAAIIAPTLVTGRYVQLVPPYTGGDTLADGSEIPIDRTATPVEFDEVKQQLVRLTDDLGPTSADEQGSLNRFLTTTARTVNGNGQVLRQALVQLSGASGTLNRGGTDLFATVRNLQQFVSAMSAADNQIRTFSDQLATFSGVLADNRTETDQLLASLASAFDVIKNFVDTNREALVRDVGKANDITGLLVDRVDTLADILHVAPTAVSDFYNIYDPVGNSLTGALGIPDIPDPQSLICALVATVNAPEGQCASTLTQIRQNAATAAARAGVNPSASTTPAAPTSAPTSTRPGGR